MSSIVVEFILFYFYFYFYFMGFTYLPVVTMFHPLLMHLFKCLFVLFISLEGAIDEIYSHHICKKKQPLLSQVFK